MNAESRYLLIAMPGTRYVTCSVKKWKFKSENKNREED